MKIFDTGVELKDRIEKWFGWKCMKILTLGAKLKDSFETWKCSYHRKSKGIIHLVCAQIFRRITFLPPDSHTYVYMSGGE